MAEAGTLEQRTVEVNDPKLSADANRRLTEAVRTVIGADRVTVPADRPRISQGERPRVGPLRRITAVKAATIGSLAVAVVVALIITMTGNHWWLLVVTFLVLAVALTAVTLTIIGLASTTEYPDPTLCALLAEEGMRDPEVRFTEIVREFTPVGDGGYGHRDVAVEDDPTQAAAEQRDAGTPSGGRSEAVGPGS